MCDVITACVEIMRMEGCRYEAWDMVPISCIRKINIIQVCFMHEIYMLGKDLWRGFSYFSTRNIVSTPDGMFCLGIVSCVAKV